MADCRDNHHRRSIRLQGYDYAQAGAYFVTICTQDRDCLFGEVIAGEMRLNDAGQIVLDSWNWMGNQYDHIGLDEYVIMPNHFHGIIVIIDPCRGGSRTAPTNDRRKPLGRLIGAFKTVSTKRINETKHPVRNCGNAIITNTSSAVKNPWNILGNI